MSGEGTVWDHGPQYPDLWPEPAGEPAVGLGDPTPPSPSPVDIDAREAAERPAPQPRPAPKRPPAWWRRRILGLAVWAWLVAVAAIVVVAVIATTSGGDDPQLVIDTTTPSTVSVVATGDDRTERRADPATNRPRDRPPDGSRAHDPAGDQPTGHATAGERCPAIGPGHDGRTAVDDGRARRRRWPPMARSF